MEYIAYLLIGFGTTGSFLGLLMFLLIGFFTDSDYRSEIGMIAVGAAGLLGIMAGSLLLIASN